MRTNEMKRNKKAKTIDGKQAQRLQQYMKRNIPGQCRGKMRNTESRQDT